MPTSEEHYLSGDILEEGVEVSIADLCRMFAVEERPIVELGEEGGCEVDVLDEHPQPLLLAALDEGDGVRGVAAAEAEAVEAVGDGAEEARIALRVADGQGNSLLRAVAHDADAHGDARLHLQQIAALGTPG